MEFITNLFGDDNYSYGVKRIISFEEQAKKELKWFLDNMKNISSFDELKDNMRENCKLLYNKLSVYKYPSEDEYGMPNRLRINKNITAWSYYSMNEFIHLCSKYGVKWNTYEVALDKYRAVAFVKFYIQDISGNKVSEGTMTVLRNLRTDVPKLNLNNLNKEPLKCISDIRIINHKIEDLRMFLASANGLMSIMSLGGTYPIFLAFGLDDVYIRNFLKLNS